MNVRVSSELVREMEELIRKKRFKSKKQAVEDALRILIAREKVRETDSLIEEIRKGTEGKPGLTEKLLKDREEEDVHSCGP